MLVCIVIIEAERECRRQAEPGLVAPKRRSWRGLPESRDWDRLETGLRRDGWTIKSHRREFVEDGRGERKDQVEFVGR